MLPLLHGNFVTKVAKRHLFVPLCTFLHLIFCMYLCTQGYLPPESFRSTSLAPLGANWVSKEAENFKELEFFGLVRYFSVKTEKSSKTSKIEPKTWKKRHFWAVFWNLCNFDWKTAHQTKKFEFLEVFRFFWHPVCPQWRETSGDIPIWTFCFENLTTVVPSRIFFVFFKIKSEASFTGLRLKKGYYYTFSVWNHMNLRLLQSTIALFWNDLRGKYPCVQGPR